MIELPDKKKCYNLPEQVAQNLLNITYLAEQYKNIDALPAIWQSYKETFDAEQETFEGWTTTFEGWDTTLSTYLTNMSSAAVSAIAGQNIAPANVNATTAITAPSIIETMSGYTYAKDSPDWSDVYVSICKNGNKLTFVIFGAISKDNDTSNVIDIANFTLPADIADKLYPYTLGALTTCLDTKVLDFFSDSDTSANVKLLVQKPYSTRVAFQLRGLSSLANATYYFRIEETFLLSSNMA